MTGRLMIRTVNSERLNTVSVELRQKYRTLGELQSAETTNKANAYKDELMKGTSAATTDKIASVHIASYSSDIMKLRGEISALEEERDHLRFCIKYNLG